MRVLRRRINAEEYMSRLQNLTFWNCINSIPLH
jgi:hypothetical protein